MKDLSQWQSVVLAVWMLATAAMAAEVNLSVAASMKDVVNELTDSYTKKNPSVKFIKNYGASGALAKQIEHGAPADLYISANEKWMDYLKDKKLMDNRSIVPLHTTSWFLWANRD